jgi:hypothetical protein
MKLLKRKRVKLKEMEPFHAEYGSKYFELEHIYLLGAGLW